MTTVDRNDLDSNIAQARALLSLLALLSWYVDPANGGWFFIDRASLMVLSLHLSYSVIVLGLFSASAEVPHLPLVCTGLDILFAAAVTVITEGPTSPSWLFFLFAILAVDCRTGFRAAIVVTIGSALLYFGLLETFVPGAKGQYLMRSTYLAILGYLIGFIGEQRTRFEARVHDLEATAERHEIARTLHDGYVQALAGVNLRLETCRTLMQSGRGGDALGQLTELQKGVTREYDAVRAYIRSLADIDQLPEGNRQDFEVETLFQLNASFSGRAPVVEQILQIALEGMRNTWRHGKATRASIDITSTSHVIRVAMRDDGVGFSTPEQPPWAIASRVAESGGRLRIDSGGRNGAHLEIEIPAV